jgi:hypothetical protein
VGELDVERLARAICNHEELARWIGQSWWVRSMEVARSEAEAFLTAFAADPARARAVVAFLLTEEDLARAYRYVESHPITLGPEADDTLDDADWMARAIIAALRSPDPADAPEDRS